MPAHSQFDRAESIPAALLTRSRLLNLSFNKYNFFHPVHSLKPACTTNFSTSRSISFTASAFFFALFRDLANCDSVAAMHCSRYWAIRALSRGEVGFVVGFID